jgi:hypothetical protein
MSFNTFPLKDFKENLSNIIKDNIDLPKLQFIACNRFKDYDILPISDYNFSRNRITICFDKLSSLTTSSSQGIKIINQNRSEDKNINLYISTNTDNLDEIKIRYFEALFLKEFSYFYEINKNFNLKKISLNDKAKLSINACRYEILHRYPMNKNDKIDLNFSNKTEILFYDELIRRCAYNEFKYKFNNDIEFEASKSDENINELTRKYINANYVYI